jgi:hypothetical protein
VFEEYMDSTFESFEQERTAISKALATAGVELTLDDIDLENVKTLLSEVEEFKKLESKVGRLVLIDVRLFWFVLHTHSPSAHRGCSQQAKEVPKAPEQAEGVD